MIVGSDSCEWRYRAEPGSERNRRWTGEGEGGQTNIFPVDGGSRSQLKSVNVKDCLQVAVCEPMEVDDDGEILGRQRINNTEHVFVR